MDKGDRHDGKDGHSGRDFSGAKRFGPTSSHGKNNPFNAMSPLATASISSPTTGGSSAFGLGSGAFASFGSASKTPKTPGTAFDFGKAPPTPGAATPTEKNPQDKKEGRPIPQRSMSNLRGSAQQSADTQAAMVRGNDATWPLKYSWVIWYRPPTSKNSDYEKSTKALCKMTTAQQFWQVYSHLKHPSQLPTVSDYHFFREGIRPVWEDEENKKGGKWIMRLKKGVADRYWEDLLLAMIGDQFAEAGEEVCGAVVSVRSGEDVFSIWTKNDGGRNVKIRYVHTSLTVACRPTANVHLGKLSSAFLHCQRIRTWSGRVTTIASLSAALSTKLARTRRAITTSAGPTTLRRRRLRRTGRSRLRRNTFRIPTCICIEERVILT